MMWTKLLSLATGLNWWRLGIYALVIAGYTGAVGGYAYHKASLKCEQAKTKQAEVRYVEVVKEVEKRVPVVQIREVESAKQKAEINRLKGELDEAINNRPKNPSCDLSDAERRGVDELLKKTHSPE